MTQEAQKPGRLATYVPAIFVWVIVAISNFLKTGPDVLRGTLTGNDDYMRLVQIRDWLGGQAWGDPVQSRMFPGDPLISHWSRFPDILVGGTIKLLTPVFGAAGAETAALILIPTLLLLAAIILAVRIAVSISDATWVPLAAALSIGLCLPAFHQFYPGRIDHHGLQIVLALGTALAIIGTSKRPRLALTAGGLCGLSFWVGIESAPYIAAACIAVSVNWALSTDKTAGRALMLFGLSMAAVTALCLLISPAQSRISLACDAISPVFAVLTAAIAIAMVTASLLGNRLKSPVTRLAAISGLGVAAAALTVALYPQCLHGPYALLDPKLTEIWLSNVGEARPFHYVLWNNPASGLGMIIVPALAVLGLFFGYPKAPVIRKVLDSTAARTLIIFVIITALTGLIQTRMFSFAGALAAPLAAVFIARMADKADALSSDLSRALVRVSILAVLSPLLIPGLVGIAFPKAQSDKPEAVAASDTDTLIIKCDEPVSLRALAKFPKGYVVTQIDLGAPTLAATQHAVTTAPYHRNEKGLLAALDIYMGDIDQARNIATGLGADYLIACKDLEATDLYSKMAPDGLLAALKDGNVPDWLSPLTLPVLANGQDNPLLAYRIIKSTE